MTKSEAIFALVIEVMGKEKVGAILKKVGFSGEPTPKLCMEALDKKGKAFAKPFGKLAKQAGQSPRAKEILLNSAILNKASGTATGTGMTAQQKSDAGLQWFNAIAGLFGEVIDSVDDIENATNGTSYKYAEAEMLRQERLRQEQAQKNNMLLIFGGIGVLLVVIILVIALAKRQ